MSSARSLCWLPAALCAELSTALQNTLAHWASTWGLPVAGPVQGQLLDAGELPLRTGVNLHAPGAMEWRNAIAGALFQRRAGESAIVDGVLRRVMEHLDEQLKRHFPHAPLAEPQAGLPGHRGLRLTMELLGQGCWLELGCAQLRAAGWLKPAPRSPLPPVDLERAASGLPLVLTAELGRTSINVSELMQLAPGDVLLLEEALDAPLRIVSAGSLLALPAHLGAIADPPRRAARWLVS